MFRTSTNEKCLLGKKPPTTLLSFPLGKSLAWGIFYLLSPFSSFLTPQTLPKRGKKGTRKLRVSWVEQYWRRSSLIWFLVPCVDIHFNTSLRLSFRNELFREFDLCERVPDVNETSLHEISYFVLRSRGCASRRGIELPFQDVKPSRFSFCFYAFQQNSANSLITLSTSTPIS